MAISVRWCGRLTTLAALGSTVASAGAGAPELVINWSVNGGPTNYLLAGGTPAGGGAFVYEGTSTDPDTGLELIYDLNGNPVSELSGNVKIFNALSSTITVSVDVILPFDPDFPTGTLLSGIVVVGLTTGPGGGMISSVPPALFHTLIDGGDAGSSATLFWDPFFMSSTGLGNLASYSDYGIPQPVPGPPLFNSLGCALDFELTSGELASISPSVTVDGDAEFCGADVDGDGTVTTADLHLLVQDWGDCAEPDCPADFNGDGVVDVADLLILLASWGPC